MRSKKDRARLFVKKLVRSLKMPGQTFQGSRAWGFPRHQSLSLELYRPVGCTTTRTPHRFSLDGRRIRLGKVGDELSKLLVEVNLARLGVATLRNEISFELLDGMSVLDGELYWNYFPQYAGSVSCVDEFTDLNMAFKDYK